MSKDKPSIEDVVAGIFAKTKEEGISAVSRPALKLGEEKVNCKRCAVLLAFNCGQPVVVKYTFEHFHNIRRDIERELRAMLQLGYKDVQLIIGDKRTYPFDLSDVE